MITFDYGRGEGGKKCQNIDYVIFERPLTMIDRLRVALYLVLIPLFYFTVQCSVAPYRAQFCAFIPALQLGWGTLGELTACCV